MRRGFLHASEKKEGVQRGQLQNQGDAAELPTSVSLLATLPDDILLHIGTYLNGKSLGRCLCVCHDIRRVFLNEEFWQVRCQRIAECNRLPGFTWRRTYSTRLLLWERWRRGQYDKTTTILNGQRVESIKLVSAYDGEYVIVADVSNTLTVLHYGNSSEGVLDRKSIQVGDSVVSSCLVGTTLTVGTMAGSVKVFDVMSCKEEASHDVGGSVCAVAYSREALFNEDIKMIAAGTTHGDIAVFVSSTMADGRIISCRIIIKGHAQPVWGMKFGDRSGFLASLSRDGNIQSWALEEGIVKVARGCIRYRESMREKGKKKKRGIFGRHSIEPLHAPTQDRADTEAMVIDGTPLSGHSPACTAFAAKNGLFASGGADGYVRLFRSTPTTIAVAEEREEEEILPVGSLPPPRPQPFVASSSSGSFNRYATGREGSRAAPVSRPASRRGAKKGVATSTLSQKRYIVQGEGFSIVDSCFVSKRGISSLHFDRENDKLFAGTASNATVIGTCQNSS
mmetsp:Transcript_334/g.491  ORF Transcript_334/g.491 Transcript_334/m.491 type:complete len:508 (-) Transcript_334:665-2188(-)